MTDVDWFINLLGTSLLYLSSHILCPMIYYSFFVLFDWCIKVDVGSAILCKNVPKIYWSLGLQ